MIEPEARKPSTEQVATPIRIGLQEWSVCCQAMVRGALMLMVRKGGIHEAQGGLFTLEHNRFVLMPTYLHQHAARLRDGFLDHQLSPDGSNDPEPGVIAISAWAEAVAIWKVADLKHLHALADELAWSATELDTRFHYRQPGVHVVALRVWRLPQVVRIADHASYAGCRSWVPLQQAIAVDGSVRVLEDGTLQRRLAAIALILDHGR